MALHDKMLTNDSIQAIGMMPTFNDCRLPDVQVPLLARWLSAAGKKCDTGGRRRPACSAVNGSAMEIMSDVQRCRLFQPAGRRRYPVAGNACGGGSIINAAYKSDLKFIWQNWVKEDKEMGEIVTME